MRKWIALLVTMSIGTIAFAANGWQEAIEQITELSVEIQDLHFQKLAAIGSLSPGANTHTLWVKMWQSRRILPASRAETDALSNINTNEGDYDLVGTLTRKSQEKAQLRDQSLTKALVQFPQMKDQIITLMTKSYLDDRAMAMYEKTAISTTFITPYPGANQRYNAESSRFLGGSSKLLAEYRGQMAMNDKVEYVASEMMKPIEKKMSIATKRIFDLPSVREMSAETLQCNFMFTAF